MVALENSDVLDTPRFRISNLIPNSLTAYTAAAAALVTLITVAGYGFSENGVRVGSQVAWRFAFFVFFASMIAGPLCRLVPFGLCRNLGPQRRQLIWSFCAAFAVYLASVFVPNLFMAPSAYRDGLSAGMLLFVVFCGALAATLAYAASPHASAFLGDKARRAILAVAISYFWLSYALTGLAHISGPHRPEIFYGLSLSLMIAALLLRFADHFAAKWKGEPAEA